MERAQQVDNKRAYLPLAFAGIMIREDRKLAFRLYYQMLKNTEVHILGLTYQPIFPLSFKS